MRVLLVTPMPPDRRGAGAIPALLHAQLSALRESHDVTLVCVAGPDPAEIGTAEALARSGVDIHPIVRRLEHGTLGWPRRRRLVGSWVLHRLPMRTAWFAEPQVQSTIDALAAGGGYDVALVEDNAMAGFRFPDGLPTVLTEYEVRKARHVEAPPRSAAQWPAWAFRETDWRRWPRYQRQVWSRFDLLQVLTERDAEAAKAISPEVAAHIRVNPFAIELPDVGVSPGAEDTILFAGNYTHPPNVDAVLWLAEKIFPRVLSIRPGARLVVAGPDPTAEVHALAGPHVSVLGRVPDLDEELRRATVVCAPVRTGGGMRMKVLHGMAMAKPVVTTSRGAAGFLGEGEPPVAIADDAEAFASCVVRLLENADVRQQLGLRAREYVELHHSPPAYGARITAVLEEAVAIRATDG